VGSGPPAGRKNGRVGPAEESTARARRTHSTEGSAEAGSDRLAPQFARLTAKAVGRAREQAEDIWADAQSLRQEERPVLRRTATLGLAGLLRAGDVIVARAREAAAQASARTASARSDDATRSEGASDLQDVTG
jgi:hypothetical protein